jgi:hypothetical protein
VRCRHLRPNDEEHVAAAIFATYNNDEEHNVAANALANHDEELVAAAIFANNNEEHAVANTLANHAEELDAAIALVATGTYVNVGLPKNNVTIRSTRDSNP